MIYRKAQIALEELEAGNTDAARMRLNSILRSEEVEGYPSPETATAARCTTNTREFNDHARKMALAAIADAPECDAVKGGIWPLEDAPRYLLADRLKDWLEDMRETVQLRPRHVKADVLELVLAVGSIGRVDFDALAKHWLATVREV